MIVLDFLSPNFYNGTFALWLIKLKVQINISRLFLLSKEFALKMKNGLNFQTTKFLIYQSTWQTVQTIKT